MLLLTLEVLPANEGDRRELGKLRLMWVSEAVTEEPDVGDYLAVWMPAEGPEKKALVREHARCQGAIVLVSKALRALGLDLPEGSSCPT